MTDTEVARRLVNKQNNAKKRNIHFDLSFKRMKQMCLQKTCFYTGITFQGIANDIAIGDGEKKLAVGPFAMSIDRVDNNLGYIDSNVVACTVQINHLKANMTPKMFEQVMKGIAKVRKRNSEKNITQKDKRGRLVTMKKVA